MGTVRTANLRMHAAIRRFVSLLFAFLLCANASTSFAAGGSSCCADAAAEITTSCHDTAADALSCAAAGQRSDEGPSGCGEQCTYCTLAQSTTPAALLMSAVAGFAVRAPFDLPVLGAAVVPDPRPERLERPPSLAV
jgi:hypothetical protein